MTEHRHFLQGAMVALALTAACVAGGRALGQDWITPQTCQIDAAHGGTGLVPQADRDAVARRAAGISNGTGRLWKITAPPRAGGGGEVSYLWGSFHSSDRLILDLPAEVRTLVPKLAVLVLESDPRPRSRAALEERALQAGMWRAPADGDDPKRWLSGPLRDWILARMRGVTFQDSLLGRVTDAGLAALLMQDPCEDFSAGVWPVQDISLALAAHQAGVPLTGLEPWGAFLEEMSQPERQDTARAIAQIYGAYLDPQGFGAARAAAVALYRQGRVGEMIAWNQLFLEQVFGKAEAARLGGLADGYLIDERNQTFLRQMGRHLAHGRALFVVGAFHLPGQAGLLAGLRVQGYQIERIRTAGEG